jgi:BirA family biotin operon repressor/biotin-[acetyl-CoA-carboxylase] ligase
MVGDRKVGGILPEASVAGGHLEHVVIGLGLNVTQGEPDFPPELRGSATSLAAEGGSPDRRELLRALLAGLRAELSPTEWLAQRVVPRYVEVCDTIGRRVRATAADRSIEGTASGIGPSGELLVETSRGTESVSFGEIVHLD